MMRLQSYACGTWHEGTGAAAPIRHAITGEQIYEASTGGINFNEVLQYGRRIGGPPLRALTFHERALRLKELAVYLNDRKEEFYTASKPTGATRNDSWIDIEGGISTLFVYSSKARRELPNESFHVEGPPEKISRGNTFTGQHICVPLEGVATHINAFNFPCWGMLEKFAPTFLAGVPSIIKPATSSCYLAAAMARAMIESRILPEGSLQILCGSVGNLFDYLTCQDVVTFTGSKDTGIKLRTHARISDQAVRFNQETDSLNCTILGPDVSEASEEFDLFVKEVVREMTVKAGQKCTVIRRIIVPNNLVESVGKAIGDRLSKITVGNPERDDVKMGSLISVEQRADVRAQTDTLLRDCEIISGNRDSCVVLGADAEKGAFLSPLLLACKKPLQASSVHNIEPFGPVSTLMGYDSLEEAIELARLGGGSLVASVFTPSDDVSRRLALGIAPFHGRILLMNTFAAKESTGHGSPLPHLVHGGPGRAGGGEELGGLRSVLHYMQRVALQGSPQRLSQITRTWIPGAHQKVDALHPFRKFFDELEIGETFHSGRRKITDEDVRKFADLSGDRFYVHLDDEAVKHSIFERRVAHGYLVISAAAGLFVDPAPGPVLANYGLENLRFIKPVYIDDEIHVRITCKQKTPKHADPQGVVAWDVEVSNQHDEAVAIYTVLTLVQRKEN